MSGVDATEAYVERGMERNIKLNATVGVGALYVLTRTHFQLKG